MNDEFDGKILCSDYLEVYNKLSEKNQSSNQNFFLTIRESQRKKLLEWMTLLCIDYQMSLDCFDEATFIMDSFFLKNQVSISKLQLYSATSLLIAAKFSDSGFPAIQEFTFLCDGLYSNQDIKQCEIEILQKLDYRIARINRFPPKFVAAAKIELFSVDIIFMEWIAEISLWNSNMTFLSPEIVANAIISIINNGFFKDKNDSNASKLIKENFEMLKKNGTNKFISGNF